MKKTGYRSKHANVVIFVVIQKKDFRLMRMDKQIALRTIKIEIKEFQTMEEKCEK